MPRRNTLRYCAPRVRRPPRLTPGAHPRYNITSRGFPAAHNRQKERVLSKSPKEEQRARAEATFKRKEAQAREGAKAMAEYEAIQSATRAKTARLKQMREAKEAAEAKVAAEAPAKKAAKKKG